jgi:outer membrane protein, heavy metal efflux system
MKVKCNKKTYIAFLFIVFFCMPLICLQAQIDTTFKRNNIDFEKYLKLVGSNNLELAAEKFNVSISDAEIEIAKVFPDPSFSFDWTENYENKIRSGYGFTSSLGTTIELGGKRGARIDLAESKKALSQAFLDDYFRGLRAEASLAYLEALKQKQLFRIKLNSYNTMKQLSDAVGIRFKLGSNAEIDETQSKLETGVLLNDVLKAEADWKNSYYNISLMVGNSGKDTTYAPLGNLSKIERVFDLNNLIETAQINRTDLLAALQTIKVAEKGIQLAEKERSINLDIRVGIGKDYSILSSGTTANSFTGGISIPLKISNIYSGAVQVAKLQKQQADELYKKVKLQIEIEIRQNYQTYLASLKQVESFEKGLLEKGRKVMEGKIYSYKRGETSLLEVLIAQRTFNDIQTEYYEALGNNIVALIQLEKAAGIWDINL